MYRFLKVIQHVNPPQLWPRLQHGALLQAGTIDLQGANYRDWHLYLSEEEVRGPAERRPDGWPVSEVGPVGRREAKGTDRRSSRGGNCGGKQPPVRSNRIQLIGFLLVFFNW